MAIPGATAGDLAASRDNLSRIRGNLRAQRSKMRDHFEQTRQSRLSLMVTDLEVGFTFARIAACSSRASTRIRNKANAHRALDTVDAMVEGSTLTNDERDYIAGKISELRAALKQLV